MRLSYLGWVCGSFLLLTGCASVPANHTAISTQSASSITQQEQIFGMEEGVESSVRGDLSSTYHILPGALQIVFTDYTSPSFVSGWWFTDTTEPQYFIGIKQADQSWLFPQDIQQADLLCSTVTQYHIPFASFTRDCLPTQAALDAQVALQQKLIPFVEQAFGVRSSDIIVSLSFSTENYAIGTWRTRKAPYNDTVISHGFIAIPQKNGTWSLPEVFFGNGYSYCDTSIPWNTYPKKFVEHIFGDALENMHCS